MARRGGDLLKGAILMTGLLTLFAKLALMQNPTVEGRRRRRRAALRNP